MNDLIPGILELLVCPACRSRLTWDYEANDLLCTGPGCGLAFPVRGGIPILVIDEARKPDKPQP